jgi:3-oxoacyl-[acyl-carrier protein] reductase
MNQKLLNFDGRIIGAAGGGIGTSTVRMLAEAGATVVATSRSQEKIDKNLTPLRMSRFAMPSSAE